MKLTEKEALQIINTVVAELEKRGKPGVVAVADDHGELLGFLRMKGAKLSSITIAINKAYTAARAQKTTMEIGKAVKDQVKGYDIAYYGDSRFIGWGGGVPFIYEGVVIGSVAVSGLTQEEDEEVAGIGIKSVSK